MSARLLGATIVAAALAASLAALTPATAHGAAPAPCRDTAQVTDPIGDGHHEGTDLTGGWFSEANGTLQGVVRVKAGIWVPEHDDEAEVGSGYALLFTHAGSVRYVRAIANAAGVVSYDFGTFAGSAFTSAGATTGSTVAATGGTATIDIPAAAMGITAGSRLTGVFALTHDGSSAGVPHWVDRAPGGVSPTEASFGADYTVGSCTNAVPDPLGALTAINARSVAKVFGTGSVLVRGSVLPARAGVDVTVARTTGTVTRRFHATTAGDGSFRVRIPIDRRAQLRATAEGVGSQTLSIDVQSRVRIVAWRNARGQVVVSGVASPALRGEVLLLDADAVDPSATRTIAGGRFRMLAGRIPAGRYQIVFIPAGEQAERSVSNTAVVRSEPR